MHNIKVLQIFKKNYNRIEKSLSKDKKEKKQKI